MNEQNRGLLLYGSREEIRELADRARRFLPNGKNLKDHEALALAQISVAYQLNPFNGEVWYIPAKGPMVGIKGLRKAARQQSGYMLRQHDMDMGEREQRLLQDGDIGRICELYRVDLGVQMQQANIPFVGEGIARQNERAPHTKSLAWLADKRAEADALKKAFDLPFGFDEQRNGSVPADLPDIKVFEADVLREPERSAPEAAAELYGDWLTGEAAPEPPPAEPELKTEAEAKPPANNGDAFASPAVAIAWGYEQGVFRAMLHAQNAYDKVKAEKKPKTAAEMAALWRADVAARIAAKLAERIKMS